MIKRTLQRIIEQHLLKDKVIVLYGARQVGKTTLCQEILKKYDNSHYINCDDPTIIQTLENQSIEQLNRYYGKYQLLVIDEAQRVENIGLVLKMMKDTFNNLQIIATGSSSFDLANKINEPLTGRAYIFHLYPLSIQEIGQNKDFHTLEQNIHHRIIHGMYPDVVISDNEFNLRLLSEQYLYKDVLMHQNIKKSSLLFKILQALALQLGSEVSYNELAQLLGSDVGTIIKYIDLLEQSFVIFGLHSFNKNARNELKKAKKYYFWDTGIRNGLIKNFAPWELRTDKGALRENFIIVERIKYLHNHLQFPNTYFWRTTTQQEIDYIEQENDFLKAYEIKSNIKKKAKIPSIFEKNYKNYKFSTIDNKNFWDFVGM